MARTRRSPPQTRRENDGEATSPSVTGSVFAGVAQDEVESDPDQYFGELFKGAHFKSLNVSEQAQAGGEVIISGVVHFDAPSVVITTRGMRVKIDSPSLNNPIIEEYTNIQHCNDRAFSISVPVPDAPDTAMSITVTGEHTNALGTWVSDDVKGPNRVNILSEEDLQREQIQDYIPWGVAGAGVGVGLNRQFDYTDSTRAALGGAALGTGTKLIYNYTGPVAFDFDIPTTEIAVIGGSALAVALLLERTGVSSVLSATGGVAGTAIETTKGAVDDRLGAVGE